jgi:hypothetical protein
MSRTILDAVKLIPSSPGKFDLRCSPDVRQLGLEFASFRLTKHPEFGPFLEVNNKQNDLCGAGALAREGQPEEPQLAETGATCAPFSSLQESANGTNKPRSKLRHTDPEKYRTTGECARRI